MIARPATLLALVCFGLALLAAPAGAVSRSSVERQFQSWLADDLYPEASRRGISAATFRNAFQGISLDWNLAGLVPPGTAPPKHRRQTQAEFRSPGAYFSQRRLATLAARGRSEAKRWSQTIARIEARYGVPGRFLLAIWGRETAFGAVSIPNSAIRVLATKAFMSTRKDLFRGELLDALRIVQRGEATPSMMKGSAAGAMGQPQFMPSSYLKYAVDFDGNGHADIWTSVPDTLASIANFLNENGWQSGRDWGFEVRIPAGVSCAQEGPDRARSLAQWKGEGIRRVAGRTFDPTQLGRSAMMLVPAGTEGPEFLVTGNFYVIKKYNNSDLYALFIGNLADRIAYGSGNFVGDWGDVGHMLRSDVATMQRALQAKGYDVGGADGLPGFKTRRSIGEWQAKGGLNPTCFPSPELSRRLR
ncbi:lytic murein transglycosylase [Pararhizobium mangrovi]|uniref:Lytic murein transglycosylase n=1 Tax=Pararhizobium mangrovi TaxID=2590452 RepID=A0A506U141_9HYPH|nr:lytic murein transglycosylase [Pararhizobium mangrovi]TPW26941.1 lytic murein transglycosylase [Pararhizobium mangrovi]